MNKISISNNKITSNCIKVTDNKIYLNNLSEVTIEYLNSDINLSIYIENDINIFEYIKNSKINIVYNNKSNTKIYRFSNNSSINTEINLNKKNITLDYFYSCINIDDNNYKIDINHNNKNTKANVINHGLNIKDNILDFTINTNIPKNSNEAGSNQESIIYLLGKNNSKIKPNLIINNNDIIANHSSYIGHFKDESLFYLMTRGIDKEGAIALLIKSFLINDKNLNFNNLELILNDIKNILGVK